MEDELIIKLRVSRKNVLMGRPQDCWECPVALAVNERFAGDGLIGDVDMAETSLCEKNAPSRTPVFVARTPRDASYFIAAIDRGGFWERLPYLLRTRTYTFRFRKVAAS